MASSVFRRAISQYPTRAARQEAQEHRVHIQLRNLPRTALPSDIRRLAARSKLQGIADIAIDYHRFYPSGRAYIELTHPDHLRPNLVALHNASLASMPLEYRSAPPPIVNMPPRTRGAKGRAEAAQRGVLTGNGPHGGILHPGNCVVVWGLPGKLQSHGLKMYLKDFSLDVERQEALKLAVPDGYFSLASRFLVRLSSSSEAHRLVRALHMTYFEQDKWGTKYHIRARVVY